MEVVVLEAEAPSLDLLAGMLCAAREAEPEHLARLGWIVHQRTACRHAAWMDV